MVCVFGCLNTCISFRLKTGPAAMKKIGALKRPAAMGIGALKRPAAMIMKKPPLKKTPAAAIRKKLRNVRHRARIAAGKARPYTPKEKSMYKIAAAAYAEAAEAKGQSKKALTKAKASQEESEKAMKKMDGVEFLITNAHAQASEAKEESGKALAMATSAQEKSGQVMKKVDRMEKLTQLRQEGWQKTLQITLHNQERLNVADRKGGYVTPP